MSISVDGFDGDLAEGIRELKAGQGKPIVAIGGAGFIKVFPKGAIARTYQPV
jgi:hypothetical protein